MIFNRYFIVNVLIKLKYFNVNQYVIIIQCVTSIVKISILSNLSAKIYFKLVS